MTDFKNRIKPNWAETLRDILGRARASAPDAVLAFDLDSTLFDNRPRQARIVREFGRHAGIAALTHCAVGHWTSGWDMKAAMRNCGMDAAHVERVYAEAKKFWQERFFTSDYCIDDVAIEGAAEFTHAVKQTGAILAYVTGRHEAMRAGSVEAMRKCGLVTPDGERVVLLMKPTLEESDDAYKRVAHAQLAQLGRVIAAFDNEPTHANDYRRKFPEAEVIHLATDHSGRPVELLDGVISVPHFGLTPL